MENHKLEKHYPAAHQPNHLTAALVEAGHYADISSAGASLARSKKGPVKVIYLDSVSGIWTDPDTGRKELVVLRGVVVEVTPTRFLETEKKEDNEREKPL